MSLKDLVEISKRVGSTTKKKEKASLLAHFIQQAKGKEIAFAVNYLSGQLPQGRINIGWTTSTPLYSKVVANSP